MSTVRPKVEDQLSRLSRLAEQLHAQTTPPERGWAEPGSRELSAGLRQLSGSLMELKQTIAESELERRNLAALAEIGQVVNSSLDLTTVLNEVMDTIIRLTGAERAFLMLRNESEVMDLMVARNWERASLDAAEVEISHSVVDRVARSGEPVLTTNAQADPRFGGQDSVIAYNLRSILCVPLKVKGQLTGVIYADNKARMGLFGDKERSLLSAFANQAAVAIDNARLFNDLSRAYTQTMDAMVAALDARDHETEGHTLRVVLYSMELGRRMDLPEEEMMHLRRGALMHDIGKIGIPDAILRKPGPLTPEEWGQMRLHPEYGQKMLAHIPFLRQATKIISAHQEKFDGSGYPLGLRAEEIPLGARIFAVADAFDAITSDRPYRQAQSYAKAKQEILRGSGSHFDPMVVEAFLSVPETKWVELRAKSVD
jgi:HD-GYP domain-containing protein (c-di-GMP phosphodiesterase class II)